MLSFNSFLSAWFGFLHHRPILSLHTRVIKSLEWKLRQKLHILFLHLESVQGQRLHDALRTLWETTANSTVSLLLLIKITKAQIVSPLRSLRTQYPLSYLLILLLYLTLSQRPPAKIRSTRCLTGRTGDRLSGSGTLQSLDISSSVQGLDLFPYCALSTGDPFHYVIIFFFQFSETQLPHVFAIGVLFSW